MTRALNTPLRRKLAGSTEPGRRVARTVAMAEPEPMPSWARPPEPGSPFPSTKRTPRQFALLALAEVMLTIGALVVLYVLWTVFISDAGARASQTHVADELNSSWSRADTQATEGVIPRPAPRPGHPFGVIYVPRFGKSWRRPIIEGTTLADLSRGAGHYRGTAMPGDVGNFAVAGHRLTHGSAFMKIADLRIGDPILVETRTGWFVYRVTSTRIVSPDQMDVIAPVPEHPGRTPTQALMTMTSCSPMFGSSHRYIVHADLVRVTPSADARPQVE